VPSATESGRIAGGKLGDAESAQKECARLEGALVELQVAYEQYFLGQERRPPTKQHQDLKRALNQLRNTFVNATNVRFRVANLQQRVLTFERLWERTMQEIEAGSYKRDLFKARRHAQEREQRNRAAQKSDGLDDLHIDEDLDLSDLDTDGGDTSGDELANALEQAAAAVSAPRPPSVAPTVAPSIAPRLTPTRPVPAVAPLVTPGKPVPAVAPLVTPVPGVAPAVAASKPAGLPLITPTGLPGVQAALKPAGGTGVQPALKPGVQPALKPQVGTGVPALKPQVGNGAQPALKPGQNPPRASGPSKPAVPVGSDGGLNDQKIKAIYDAYVMAKKRCGEDTSKLSLDSVASTLKSQVPSLMKQHNAKSVEFKVVIKDGKAVLRALPKE